MEEKRKDPVEIRNKIISLIRIRGPCLPVHISRETGLETLFSSAFLSELASDGIVKISSMKVGGSPLYFLPGQESLLENFSNFLPGKEKEAFLLLKEKKVLEDIKLEPAIRVALRSIKDFARHVIINYPESQALFWRFHSFPEEEAKIIIPKQIAILASTVIPIIKPLEKKPEEGARKLEQKEEKRGLDIFDKAEIKPKRAKPNPEEFLNEVKAYLSNKNIALLSHESYSKKEVTAKVRAEGKDFLLTAFNKKKINEKEIVKAYRKSLAYNLPYIILIRDVPSKKIKEIIDAARNLKGIEKL